MLWTRRGWRSGGRQEYNACAKGCGRGAATQCLRQGLSVVARNWEKEGKGPRARLIPEDVCTAFRADWGCDKIGSDGGESHGDTARREVVIEFVHDVCEGEYGGTAMSVGNPGRGEREPETAGARDEVGVGNGALEKSRPFDGVCM